MVIEAIPTRLMPITTSILALLRTERLIRLKKNKDSDSRYDKILVELLNVSKTNDKIKVFESDDKSEIVVLNLKQLFPETYII